MPSIGAILTETGRYAHVVRTKFECARHRDVRGKVTTSIAFSEAWALRQTLQSRIVRFVVLRSSRSEKAEPWLQ